LKIIGQRIVREMRVFRRVATFENMNRDHLLAAVYVTPNTREIFLYPRRNRAQELFIEIDGLEVRIWTLRVTGFQDVVHRLVF
jgi:hypothetical protein